MWRSLYSTNNFLLHPYSDTQSQVTHAPIYLMALIRTKNSNTLLSLHLWEVWDWTSHAFSQVSRLFDFFFMLNFSIEATRSNNRFGGLSIKPKLFVFRSKITCIKIRKTNSIWSIANRTFCLLACPNPHFASSYFFISFWFIDLENSLSFSRYFYFMIKVYAAMFSVVWE